MGSPAWISAALPEIVTHKDLGRAPAIAPCSTVYSRMLGHGDDVH